ncbi:hypothetical protein HNY73_001036 [Argiope bruennichi]|uniref:Uncharacterized protein n=1 Tax=Argiope bruennichi TaxID=94029 RepID=A0A8T0G3Q8_ARGBR|nr:hypothetical protein HNY73_001036 [Argiope bruennichi]
MESTSDLFQFILEREKTIVFGNLSRYPEKISELIRSKYNSMEIIVVSRYYTFPTTADDNIRSASHISAKNLQCDLLIYCEPYPYEHIEKPPKVSHMVVFTSHLAFPFDDTWVRVCFIHDNDLSNLMEKTNKLLQLQDGSIQSNNVSKLQIDHVRIQSIGSRETFHLQYGKEKTYFVIDLTSLNSPHAMLLRFWDAFDFMIRHFDTVERWMICFPEKGDQIREKGMEKNDNHLNHVVVRDHNRVILQGHANHVPRLDSDQDLQIYQGQFRVTRIKLYVLEYNHLLRDEEESK